MIKKNSGLVAEYARLSKDDDKKKYVSIQNQKNIMDKYAMENGLIVDKVFEDDGWSGYTMDRPDFNELKHLIDENMIDVLLVKDLSRLGRHNANVLLFLERLQAHNVRLILVDDNYDSAVDSDDIIGIKTWYNERYIKDNSRKVRNAIKIMQEKKEFIVSVPYGYVKDNFIKNKYYIDEEAAIWVKKIFDLYINGNGYKNIATQLNNIGAPTSSILTEKRMKERGITTRIKVSPIWSANMVKKIIENDFYVGTLRLRKTARKNINGASLPVLEDEMFVFENAHEPIIDIETFSLAETIHHRRSSDLKYKGQRKYTNPYAGLLECGDCGSSMTICHYSKGEVGAFNCRKYRDHGVEYCSVHHIRKIEIDTIVKDYLTLCRTALKDLIESLDSIIYENLKRNSGYDTRLKVLNSNLQIAHKELQTIMEQKIRDIAANPSMAEIISKTYDTMQNDKMIAIENMQAQIKEYESIDKDKSEIKRNFKTALEVFDNILNSKCLTKRQLESIIEKILIYENNTIEIKLRGELGNIFKDQSIARMSREDRIKKTIINFITSVSSFGQVRLLQEIRKNDPISYKDVLPFINDFIEKGYVILGERQGKARCAPYVCIASKEEMLSGFNICTDIDSTRRHINLGASLETLSRISIWISRYL